MLYLKLSRTRQKSQKLKIFRFIGKILLLNSLPFVKRLKQWFLPNFIQYRVLYFDIKDFFVERRARREASKSRLWIIRVKSRIGSYKAIFLEALKVFFGFLNCIIVQTMSCFAWATFMMGSLYAIMLPETWNYSGNWDFLNLIYCRNLFLWNFIRKNLNISFLSSFSNLSRAIEYESLCELRF